MQNTDLSNLRHLIQSSSPKSRLIGLAIATFFLLPSFVDVPESHKAAFDRAHGIASLLIALTGLAIRPEELEKTAPNGEDPPDGV